VNYKNISDYIEKAKELIDYREQFGNDDKASVLLDEISTLWQALTDEETLFVDQAFSLDVLSKKAFGSWLEKDWFVGGEDFTID